MSIPDFQTLMLPVLREVSKHDLARCRDVVAPLVVQFKLTEEEQSQLLPSGTQTVMDNRVYWAFIYLDRAQLVRRPERGRYQITDLGKTILEKKPEKIDIKFLNQFESFRAFKAKSNKNKPVNEKETQEIATDPREALEDNYENLKNSTCAELLSQLRQVAPRQFELLVVKILKKMGYGVPGLQSVIHTGKSGDGGVDGEFSQDSLGLDMIYIQAKRYQEGQSVGRPAIQQFVGSLNERKARKGVFITTSHFSSDAHDYIQKIDMKVVLIDGERLAQIMFDFNLGVSIEQQYEVKKIDVDFFEAA